MSRASWWPANCCCGRECQVLPKAAIDTRWRFVPLEQGSEVHFLTDFAFGNVLLSAVAGVAFGFVSAGMTEAFIRRADDLYRSVSLRT